ncbi:MAG TPA: GAF domain-containing sensor histidine kinase [Candidatus Dormibacteraeota bacterium]|nr:GAF domain-containing sensor histidine kinase [Candidatus Dormibacteraeota bacterium]
MTKEGLTTRRYLPSNSRVRFNWRLWVVLGALTELFLIYVARWWAPSPVTYFLAVLFLPVMVLTGFWSFKYFKLVQQNLELSRRADQNLQELSHFFEVATAVSNLTKLGEDLGTLTTKLAELLDVEMCGFFLYQDGLEALIAPAAPSGMRESRLFNQMRLNQLRFGANASTLIGRVFVTQQPTIIADCLHDIEAGQLLPQTFGYRDLLLVPLGSGGRPIGVLMLANKRHGEFSGNYDVKLAASLGAEVAVSLQNTFLFEQTRQQALRLDTSMEMLRQVSQALTATTVGPNALLQGVARAVIGVSGAATCLITLTQSGNPAEQAVEVGEGFEQRLQGEALTYVAPGLITQVVIEQRPVFSEDIQLDGRFPLDPLAQQYGWRAALGLPMFLEREFVGTVSVYFREVRAFDPTLMQVLQILANQAAVALDNARRFQRERQTIEMLQRANLELQEADRMKSEFLTNMSHELRTPLNAIIGFSEIIRTTPELSEAERAEFAETIHSSGRQLLTLINDILDLTHIQAGRLELHPAPCLVAEAVDAALSENAAAATQKELTVTSQVDRAMQVVFDARSLRHIVHNLVNNAIKFTSHHGSVTIRAMETTAGTVVEVVDTGIGIKPEDQPRLFEEFRQIDGSTSRGYEGIGLGLALSKRLVELQGGQIWVESVPGRGSTFRFLIPRHPVMPAAAPRDPILQGPLPRVA